jgi:hypothetical protein
MNDDYEKETPREVAEARELVNSLTSGVMVAAAPTASDVQVFIRNQNWKLGIIATLLFVVGISGTWFSAGGRAASRDSFNSTSIQLANQARNACITELRNEGLDAIGRAIVEGLQAQKSALIDRDRAATLTHLDAFDQAVLDRQANADATEPDALDERCGPPILSLDDLPGGSG